MKLSVRKLSVLGLVLMAASAVTAAVLPAKADNNADKLINGSLTDDSEPGNNKDSSVTCAPETEGGTIQQACNASTGDTGGSETTGALGSGPDSTSATAGANTTNAG